jgi:hypothetical protein
VRRVLAALLLLLLALPGCAGRAAGPAVQVPTYAGPGVEVSEEVSVARTVLSAVATPFYWIFKAATCATTAVIAVPAAAVLALTEPAFEQRQREELDEGVARNCGPPYILH